MDQLLKKSPNRHIIGPERPENGPNPYTIAGSVIRGTWPPTESLIVFVVYKDWNTAHRFEEKDTYGVIE